MRAENIGKVTENQMRLIGAVGMAARVASIPSDIRQTHPFAGYKKYAIGSQILDQGDVWARMMLRSFEVQDSIDRSFKFAKSSPFPNAPDWASLNFSSSSPLADKLLVERDSEAFDAQQESQQAKGY